MENRYGIRVVTPENIKHIIEEAGIKPWRHIAPSVGLHEYMQRELTGEQRRETGRFAPKAEAVFLEQPDGSPFTEFRTVTSAWSMVFALLPDN